MKRTAQVVVTGPLASYAAGYRRELSSQGYSAWTVVSYLYSLARVSRWLAEHGFTAADLDAECVERFLAERPASRRSVVQRRTPRGMMSLLGYLRALGLLGRHRPHNDVLLVGVTPFSRQSPGQPWAPYAPGRLHSGVDGAGTGRACIAGCEAFSGEV